jgi:PBSX family phage terminase large subunit
MKFLKSFGPRVGRFALYPIENDCRINILEGSVRSSKTWALHAKILQGCRYRIGGWRFITGESKDTIFTNVLNDLFALVGPKYYNYNHQTGILRLLKSTWKVMGAKDEGSEKFLRGSTIGLAICDELVLMPKGFFQMLLTRMSPKGARLYGSTNPDSPMHWLKTDYLDDPVLRKKKLLYSLHVTMDDNPNLDPEFVESQKAFYKGLFYQRFILGQWVMAEGSIWGDAWNDDLIYDEAPLTLKNAGGFVDHWISNDYGTNHPMVFQEFWDDGDVVWLDREWVWDSKEEMRQLTDGQYAEKLIEFMGRNGGCQVLIPPDALSFRQECINRGIWVTEANNEVVEGIQTVAGMMVMRKLRVNRQCRRTIRGINTYVWDPSKARRGIEEPLAQGDDEASALRYGLHSKIPRWRFMQSA